VGYCWWRDHSSREAVALRPLRQASRAVSPQNLRWRIFPH